MKLKLSIFYALIFLLSVTVHAQTTKNVELSHGIPYTEQLTFKDEAKDMELNVKLLYDEDRNIITMTLTSPKNLFVFWGNTRYKDVFHHRWLQTEKLPYIVSSNTADCFRATRKFRKSFDHPRKKHPFVKWFEVEGLQPDISELKLVNDSISQSFAIQDGHVGSVTFRLRDVLVMNEVQHSNTGRKYEIFASKDFDIRYRISLHRNPCLGLDDEISAASGALDALKKNFTAFKNKYGSGSVDNDAALNEFKETQTALLARYPRYKSVSLCPDIQTARDQYNQMLDSIQGQEVKVEPKTLNTIEDVEKAVNAQAILSNSRQLDRLVSKWLVSDDQIERSDIVDQCNNIIKETNVLIGNGKVKTAEERRAIDLFRKAQQYYKNVISEQ